MRAVVLIGLTALLACTDTKPRARVGERCDAERTCRPPSFCAVDGVCRLPATPPDAPVVVPGADAGLDAEADATSAADGLPTDDTDAAQDAAAEPDAREPDPGCADGTREGFQNRALYPHLAACAGGWTVPGVTSTPSRTPVCGRTTGNDGEVGVGCAVEDLCAPGWHVCESLAELKRVTSAAVDGGIASFSCDDTVVPGGAEVFYVTRQRGHDLGSGMGTECDDKTASSNNVMGCGTLGVPATRATCQPFRMLAYRNGGVSDCNETPPWDCGTDNKVEADQVRKWGPSGGGALCCRDGL